MLRGGAVMPHPFAAVASEAACLITQPFAPQWLPLERVAAAARSAVAAAAATQPASCRPHLSASSAAIERK
jgi:hypothetical protein